jgi:hypothetical protein
MVDGERGDDEVERTFEQRVFDPGDPQVGPAGSACRA